MLQCHAVVWIKPRLAIGIATNMHTQLTPSFPSTSLSAKYAITAITTATVLHMNCLNDSPKNIVS